MALLLPDHYECPIDVYIIKLCTEIAPLFKATGHTANMITFEGAIFSFYSLYLLYHHRLKEFALYYALGYIFDCLDGHYARRYHMVSKFGEYFEHIKDTLVTILYFVILLRQYRVTVPTLVLYLVAGYGLISHMGHQQKYLNSKGGILDPLQHLARDVRHIKYTKWMGCGTFMVIAVVVPFFLRWKW